MESRNIPSRTSSREEMRRERRRQQKQVTNPRTEDFDRNLYSEEKIRIRILPIWLRIILVMAFSIFAVILGLIVGFTVLGDGSFSELFKMSTWTHLIDLVLKE